MKDLKMIDWKRITEPVYKPFQSVVRRGLHEYDDVAHSFAFPLN